MKLPVLSSALPFALVLVALSAFAQAPKIPLIPNGDFRGQSSGKLVTPPYTPDGTEFVGYRLFNIADQHDATLDFSGTIIPGPTGNRAIRLDINNTYNAVAQGIYGFDFFNDRLPIAAGKLYTYSFDAAYVSGGNTLTVSIAEYNVSGEFTGEQFVFPYELPTTDKAFHTYTGEIAPTSPEAATLDIMFAPSSGESVKASMSLTNIRFGISPSKKPAGSGSKVN